MKICLLFFFLANLGARAAEFLPLPPKPVESVSTGNIGSERGRKAFVLADQNLNTEDLNRYFFLEMAEHAEELKKVKYYLLNGETRMAQVYLQNLALTQSKLRPVIYRYLALLAFIDGKFQRSLDYLELRQLQELPHFPKICTLKVLNLVILSKTKVLRSQWEKCQQENQLKLREWNVLWLETLVKLKLQPVEGITRQPFRGIRLEAMENDQLKIFLKLAIYLNQEAMVVNELKALTVDQLQDTEVRELVGHVFFRSGAFANSYKYIEDLASPNSENMKGNLYVLRNKYEIAYAQFKLALEKKQNSQNAMERIIPLAWLLGDWELGAKYAELVMASPQTQVNKLALVAAFQTSKGDFAQASKILDYVGTGSSRGSHLDIVQLRSFVALMQNKSREALIHSGVACNQFDLVNCWVMFQVRQWDNFPLTLRRTDAIVEKRTWEKLAQVAQVDELKETVFVNQIDIEELDDKLIQLIPNAP